MDNPSFIWQLVQTGGALGVLVLVSWFVLIGKLRLEREYLDMRTQRDQWRDEALAGRPLLREAAEVAERAIHSEVR